MNIPNLLTIGRILLTVIFAVLMGIATPWGAIAALMCFTVAILTDFADGYIARKYQQISVFGKIMDPIADKFLTLTAFFILAFHGMLFWWMVGLVAIREVVVTAARLRALMTGVVLPAENAGKVKTVFQMTALTLALLLYCALLIFPQATWLSKIHFPLWLLIHGIMLVAVILTVWSGVIFFRTFSQKEVL